MYVNHTCKKIQNVGRNDLMYYIRFCSSKKSNIDISLITLNNNKVYMNKGKMTSVEVNEAKRKHEEMIDQEWRRSISSGQDIERSKIAELMASDLNSTSEEELCFEDEEKSGYGDSSSDYDKPLSEITKKYLGEKQS